MKYMGSKSRIAKCIVPIIQDIIDDNDIKVYIEPFVGGANVIDKIVCDKRIGSDKNKYLIALLKHVAEEKPLLPEINREFYNDVRSNYKNKKYEDWLIGNVGFLASYNGRFFDGGYAQSGYEKTKKGERYRDYYRESKDNLLRQVPFIKNVEFGCCDYSFYDNSIENTLIYCDIPYQGTKQYDTSKDFDYDKFWDWARKMSEKNIVIISEENAPGDFSCIWEQEVSRSIKAKDKSFATEKLFILRK